MRVIAISCAKGGTGKTTTALCLASCLRDKGKKVLLVDLDPQCNATEIYRAQTKDVATLYDVIVADDDINEAVQVTDAGCIIPCDPLLIDAEQKITGLGRETILRSALQDLQERYDYVILDSPPNYGVLQDLCLVAADDVVIPITPSQFALRGLSRLNNVISTIRRRTVNTTIKVSGILITKYHPSEILSRDIVDNLPEVCKAMGTELLTTRIRESVSVEKAHAARMTLIDYEQVAGKTTVGEDYRQLTDELLKLWDKEGK